MTEVIATISFVVMTGLFFWALIRGDKWKIRCLREQNKAVAAEILRVRKAMERHAVFDESSVFTNEQYAQFLLLQKQSWPEIIDKD